MVKGDLFSFALTENEKFAAVDKAVAEILPLSSKPSRNILIIKPLRTITKSRDIILDSKDKFSQVCCAELMRISSSRKYSIQRLPTVVGIQDLDCRHNFATQEDVAAKNPLKNAFLVSIIFRFWANF